MINKVEIEGVVASKTDVGKDRPLAVVTVRVDDTIRSGERRGEPTTTLIPVRFGGDFAVRLLAWDMLRPGTTVRVMAKIDVATGRDRSFIDIRGFMIAVLSFPPRPLGGAGPRDTLAAVDRGGPQHALPVATDAAAPEAKREPTEEEPPPWLA